MALKTNKERAPRNRTINLTKQELNKYRERFHSLQAAVRIGDICNTIICQDVFDALPHLPPDSVDLVIADPPYSIAKDFRSQSCSERSLEEYEHWLRKWIPDVPALLKPHGSFYICGDWRSSAAIHMVLRDYFHVQNRITWQREKGRGAKYNWKNCSEDIWFCTKSHDYTFNVEEVKLKRTVRAPYTDKRGQPKDWAQTSHGRFRLTHPSNFWNDITVPFWSMPENTDHPTQKPEKLLAKLVLASSNKGNLILDLFSGSGTASVVAKKLDRNYIGIEVDEVYCALAEKRLDLAEEDQTIQGYADGVFWERNTKRLQQKARNKDKNDKMTSNRLF